jgi:hypothetical protein
VDGGNPELTHGCGDSSVRPQPPLEGRKLKVENSRQGSRWGALGCSPYNLLPPEIETSVEIGLRLRRAAFIPLPLFRRAALEGKGMGAKE